MKINIFTIIVTCCLLTACDQSKKTTNAMSDISTLSGTWELNYISGTAAPFEELYANKKPVISFDNANKTVSGNTSCNNFNGPLKAAGSKISFTDPMAMTRMLCPGAGENTFVETLKKVTSWSVSDGQTLNLIMGDIAVMRFTKK